MATQQISPTLSSYIKSLRNLSVNQAVDQLIELLKRRQIRGSSACALATTHVFLKIVSKSKLKSSDDLLVHVRSIGKRVSSAVPSEIAVGNITRRVLGLIRETIETATQGDDGTDGAQRNGDDEDDEDLEDDEEDAVAAETAPAAASSTHSPTQLRQIKQDILSGMREMLDELEQASEQIAGYALEHIHSSEVLLTFTSSLTVQKFLLAAAKKRRFTVIHVEGYPNDHAPTHDAVLHGHKRSELEEASSGGSSDDTQSRLKALTAAGVTVIVVPDSAAFALMSRVNKVILPAHAVLQNGSFVGAAGTKLIAQAAKAHRVPVVVLGAIFKFSPVFPYAPQTLLDHGDPGKVLPYEDGDLMDKVDVSNPLHDFIEPKLVNLYISNIGGHAPSFVYRIAADHYRPQDTDL